MRVLFQLVLFVFPWCIRRRILNKVFHYQIHPTAKIGFSIILAKKFQMGEQSRIRHFTFCKPIDNLVLTKDSVIASWNLITGFSSAKKKFFHRDDLCCELIIGAHAGITHRHLIDCNGGVYIDDFATVAGYRTQILTHSIDVYNNRQNVEPVYIGKGCFVGTQCIILPGSRLPDYSILGAGSVLNKAYTESYFIYAGNPAKSVKKIDKENIQYFYRTKYFVE